MPSFPVVGERERGQVSQARLTEAEKLPMAIGRVLSVESAGVDLSKRLGIVLGEGRVYRRLEGRLPLHVGHGQMLFIGSRDRVGAGTFL